MIFWLGLVPVQVLFGNVWRVLNPWLAIANGVEWIWRKLGQDWTPPLAYPERLGVWPARSSSSASRRSSSATRSRRARGRWRSRSRSTAMRCGSAWPHTGGREWDAHGNGFTVYFGLLARIAPFGEHEGRLVLRMPFSGLSGREATPGMLASSR